MSLRDKILQRLKTESKIPTFPVIAGELMEQLKNTETTTDQIVDTIKVDPSMSSSILRLANTVAFNSTVGKISSVHDAVIRLGFRNVSDLVISLVVIKSLPKDGLLDYSAYWNHSLSTAYACQTIMNHSSQSFKRPDDLYISGLLHEIGILILDQFFSEHYRDVLTEVKASQSPLHIVEKEMLDIDHYEVASYILERWKLPRSVIDTVRYHHKPTISTPFADESIKILHIANFACENQGLHNGVETFPTNFSREAWEKVGLEIDEIPKIIDTVNEQTEKAREIFLTALGGKTPAKAL